MDERRPVPLRQNHGFRMLWMGQVLSATGTEAALMAYPLLILALTHSVVLAGVVSTVQLAAGLVLSLPGGALADRLDRRLTMIACDSVRAAVLGLLVVLVLTHLVTWPIVLAVALVDDAANVLFSPSANAALPAIVADEQLEQAWAATEGRTYAAALVGPALGGFLFGLGRAVPFLVDVVSYLASVGTVSRIRGRFRPEASTRKALWREVADGIRMVGRNQLLRAVVIQAPLINFAFTGAIFTITLALRRHGVTPGTIGLAQAGIGAGGLLGALAAPRLQGRLSLWRLQLVLTVGGATLFAELLRAVPENMRGRVSNTVIMAATALAALAPLTAGLLVQDFSGRWAMAAFAIAIAAAALSCMILPGFRDPTARAEARAPG